MKKIIYLIAAALILLGCSEDRSRILKVYNWADYIDEDLIGEFEQWYEDQFARKYDEAFSHVTVEVLISAVKKLSELSRI